MEEKLHCNICNIDIIINKTKKINPETKLPIEVENHINTKNHIDMKICLINITNMDTIASQQSSLSVWKASIHENEM